MYRDYFGYILGKVCEKTELSVEKVLKSNMEECVDARYLVIVLLSERMNGRQIAEVSGWSTQLVSKAIGGFQERCRFRWGLKELYVSLQSE